MTHRKNWSTSNYSASGNCVEVYGFRAFHTSSHSESGNCVEVAGSCDCVEVASYSPAVLVRDTNDRRGKLLKFDGSTWGRFLAQVRDGKLVLA